MHGRQLMWYYNCNIKLNTQKAISLQNLIKKGFPVPPTLFFNYSDNEESKKATFSFLNSFTSKLYYIRLCFSDLKYPHYYGELVESRNVIKSIDTVINKANINGIKCYDVLVQPLQELAISGSILVRGKKMLVESVFGAPQTLFRDGNLNSRFILNNKNLIVEEFFLQKDSLLWNYSTSSWVRISNNNYVDKSILNIILEFDYDNDKLYEYGIDNNNQFWVFEEKKIPNNSYLSLDTIESNNDNDFLIFDNLYSEVLYIDLPVFSQVNKCIYNKKYIIKSGAYTAHLPLYLALSKIACKFIRKSETEKHSSIEAL